MPKGMSAMSKTVLVVDDDPTQRRLIQAVLDREGYAVVHAESGGEAIDRLTKGGGADVVLLDMVMPGMSGMEFCKRVRHVTTQTPLLVMSVLSDKGLVAEARNLGVQGWMLKPVEPEYFLNKLKSVLGESQALPS